MSLIIQLLENYLVQARKGTIKHLALSATGPGDFERFDFVGEIPSERRNTESVMKMVDKMQDCVDNWDMPEQDPTLDESYACFHCGEGPAGFDFLMWLVTHEMMRIKAGAPGPLKIAFWQGKKPLKFYWADNVYRPLLRIVGAVEDNKAWGRLGEPKFTSKSTVDLYNEGIALPRFKAAGDYYLPKGVITITLREAGYWPKRNSNIDAWKKFAKFLKSRGERVVFVRDSAKATEPLDGFETCPPASGDLDARMWLYQNAKLNLFVSNGPCTMNWFTDVPFLCFTPPEPEDSEYEPNRPSFWKQMMGVEVGGQYPWFNEKQRIVWERDTYDAIKRSYLKVIAK